MTALRCGGARACWAICWWMGWLGWLGGDGCGGGGQQGVAFGGGEQVEVVDGLVGVPGGLVEQVDQVAGELADGGGVEQLGAVEEVAGDGVGVVGEVEGEIEAGGGVAAWEVA